MSTPCPQPAVVDWGNERYYNPQNIKVRQGVVTFVDLCYITVLFTEGDSQAFIFGDMPTVVNSSWLAKTVEVEYHEPTKTLGYIKDFS